MHHRTTTTVGLLTLILSVALVAPATGLTSSPHWSIAAGPKVESGGGALAAVMMTKHHGFAVGNQWSKGATLSQPLIERFAAGSWRRLTAPTVSAGAGLNSVDGADLNAWAVGSAGLQGFAVHWNGHGWKRVAVPAAHNGHLNGVSVDSANDAWAVGFMTKKSAIIPWAIHWNGSKWANVSIPNPGHRSNGLPATAFLSAVTAVGRKAFAVGTADGRGRGSGRAVAEMYAGGRWHIMKLPTLPGGVGGLSSIAGTSAHSVWAVGSDYYDTPHTVALHWNGRTWSRPHTPDPGQGELSSLSIGSSHSIWAVGEYTASNGWSRPLAEHWNGTRWTRVAAPAAPIGSFRGCSGLGDAYQGFDGVSVVPGSSQVSAVGYHDRLTCNSVRLPLTERYR